MVAAGDLRCSNIPVTTGKIMQITENCYPAHPHSKKSRVFPFVASLLLFVHRVFDLIIGNLAFCVIILGDKGELPAGLKYIEYTCNGNRRGGNVKTFHFSVARSKNITAICRVT